MGIFGSLFGAPQRRTPGDFAPDPDASSMSPMPPRPTGDRTVFGHGLEGILGGVGKLLTYGPFAGMAQQGMNRRHDREALEDAYKQSQIDHRNAPQAVPLGNGGFGTWSPDGGLTVLREPTQPEQHETQQMQNIKALRALNPGMTDVQAAQILERAMSGYGYSPEAMDAKARLKAVPTYSNLHPHTAARAAPKPPAGFILDK